MNEPSYNRPLMTQKMGSTSNGRRDQPCVSMVVPSYQMSRTLRYTLESILRQTYRPIEIIVQDNCSTDGTLEILREYESRIDYLAIESDRGQSDALKRGFSRARGEILGWLNADDMLMPDAVERAVKAFQEGGEAQVVYGHCVFLRESGQFQRYFHEIEPFSQERLCNHGDFIAQPSTFFLRTAYEAVEGLDPTLDYAMDWDLWCRLAAAGCGFRFVDHVLSAARLHPGTKTGRGGLRRWWELARVNARHRTVWLPRAALANFYAEFVRQRVPVLHSPLRWLVRSALPEGSLPTTPVHGLHRSGAVDPTGFALRFPVYRYLRAGSLRFSMQHPPGTGEPRVSFGGRRLRPECKPGRDGCGWWSASFTFDPPQWCDAADLQVATAGAAPTASHLSPELLLDFA